MRSISGICLRSLLIVAILSWWPSTTYGSEMAASENINLALRRTADRLLRASGDLTSRIPPVEQTSEKVWRIQLRQTFDYDSLPHLLQASMEQYGIKDAYTVAVRRCEDDVIDLGYHQQDFIQDTMVPCLGRETPEGCHYIEVTFAKGSRANTIWPGTATTSMLIIIAGIGTWWWFRKKKTAEIVEEYSDQQEWVAIGQSRLNPASMILECQGIRHQLTYREAKLLRLFAAHPNQLLERDQIMQQVWGEEGVQVGRSIDMFVSRLRKKIKEDSSVGIVAVHGVGYRMETGITVS